jgi:hypothetical protein
MATRLMSGTEIRPDFCRALRAFFSPRDGTRPDLVLSSLTSDADTLGEVRGRGYILLLWEETIGF